MTPVPELPAELAGEVVRLRPTVAADGPALRAIHDHEAVAHWWDQPAPGFPMEDEPDAARLTIWVGDRIAGLIEFHEELEPKYRSAGIDIFVAPDLHGRGIGTEAVRLVLRHLHEERGHHRVTIDPAADNHAAIACYRKAGFTAVGRMRLAERDSDGRGWHDALLMEHVIDPGRG